MLTSILKKVGMALTGIGLFGFAITHLAGNLLLLVGPDAFNAYSDKLHSFGPLLYVAEVGLALMLLVHVYSGIRVTLENRKARPVRYQAQAKAGEATFASRTMAVGGLIFLVFLVLHIRAFKFGTFSGSNGLWGLVTETFQSELVVAWYVLAMVVLGLHLSHGIASALQSLGAQKPGMRETFRRAGFVVGWVIALGFASLPILSYVNH